MPRLTVSAGGNAASDPAPIRIEPRLQGREAVSGMGYRLAAGGLAGRLRAGDGGVGPCVEDRWVRQVARFWTAVTHAALRAAPDVAATPAAAYGTAATRVAAAGAALKAASAQAASAAVLRMRRLPFATIGQGAAAVLLAVIGLSSLVCWERSHAAGTALAYPAPLAAIAPPPVHVAKAEPPPAPQPVTALADADTTMPPPAAAAPEPAPAPMPAIVPPPAPDNAPTMRKVEAASPAPASRRAAAPMRVTAQPRTASPVAPAHPAPRHAVRVLLARYELPRWLATPSPAAPRLRIMSAQPHNLEVPVQAAPVLPPLVAAPHSDRFAGLAGRFSSPLTSRAAGAPAWGYYVPPMMPGSSLYQ